MYYQTHSNDYEIKEKINNIKYDIYIEVKLKTTITDLGIYKYNDKQIKEIEKMIYVWVLWSYKFFNFNGYLTCIKHLNILSGCVKSNLGIFNLNFNWILFCTSFELVN